jgi:two-component system, cell cycle sensor histidine kinase and response regulator CckA
MVFADDVPASRLPAASSTLQRAADMVLSRLDNVALLAELRALNVALDEKVALRTRALRSSEERARLALEAVGGSSWDWDLATGEVAWSPGVAALLGLEPGALSPALATYLDRVHPDDVEGVSAALAHVREGGQPERVVHRLAGEGGPRWLELHVRAAQGPHGSPRRAAGVVLDVTERHRLEEELRQAQKMETVGRLAGGVAHDFNNLLTTILGVSEMLLDGLPAGDPLCEDLASIRDAGRRAALLTRQLLAFSRKQRLEMRPVQLDDVVRGLAPMLSRLIGEDVAVKLDLAVGLPPVLADRSQVEQILMNLAVNARDAMQGGGTLTITIALARGDPSSGGSAGDFIRMRVGDTGAGMPPEVAARAFEPFFTTKPRGQGTGLGLATVYGIVTQHGGSVTFDTAPRKGTRFDVLLPVAPPGAAVTIPAPSPPRAARPERSGRGETILVVDDEPLVRRAICRALGLRGYEVVEAGSGEEALETVAARRGEISLLLTDVVMPGMRGPDLIREFRRRCEGRPALLMSGYPEAIEGEAPLAGGYLEKPIDPDALGRAVRAALDDAPMSPTRPLQAG